MPLFSTYRRRLPSFLYISCLCILLRCGRAKETEFTNIKIGRLADIEVNDDVSQWIQQIRIIPLEYCENCLVGEIRKVIKVKDYLVISDYSGSLFLFNLKGEFIRKIGSQGDAPQQYAIMTDFTVDEQSKTIYVNAIGALVAYDFQGNFKNRIILKDPNLQVLTSDNRENLYYILPDTKQTA